MNAGMTTCVDAPKESLTSSVLTKCERLTEELYERIDYLFSDLSSVLRADEPRNLKEQLEKPEAFPPLPARINNHTEKLQNCVNMLISIKERLVI